MANASGAQKSLRRLLAVLLPALVTLPRFRNAFVFDDVFVIQRGEFIHRLSNLPRAFVEHAMIASSLHGAVGRPAMDTYRPVSIATFFWDALLSGKQPWSYHLTNLVLHALVCLLVLELLDELLPDSAPTLRLCSALWFGLAPWLAEAHVFINGRSDLLLALFFVTALLLLRRALDAARPALAWLAAASMLLALLSKEVAVVLLPFVALVPTARAVPWRERASRAWPLGVGLCLYLCLRLFALSGLRSHGDAAQLALAARQLPLLLVDGLLHALAPTPYILRSLRDDYAQIATREVVTCALLLLALCAAALTRLRRDATLIWAFFLALGALAPATMISTTLWPGFGRYLYVPAIGLSIVLAVGMDRLLRRVPSVRPVALALAAALAAVSATLLLDATWSFESERELYIRAIARRPTQAWTYGFLGMSLRRDANCNEAIAYLNEAANMDPDDSRYAMHLGRCLVDLRSYAAASGVARRGRERFRDTRSEAGFLLIEALALPASQAAEQQRLLERCLRIDSGRTDCADLLLTVQNGIRSAFAPADAGAAGQPSR